MEAFSGVQEPADAVSRAPTFGRPVTAGRATFLSVRSLKWTKPLGQLPPVRVTRAQEKSPPQLSWEMMISSGEMTRST